MKHLYGLMITVGIIVSCSLAENSAGTIGADSIGVGDSPAVEDSVSINDTTSMATPLCTLIITTDQPEVTVKLDGETMGVTPLNIVNVDSGTYVLVLQKSGFYQKKVVITINERKATPLHFSLTAPGMLSVISEPAGAAVAINGIAAGDTPLTDTLMKPGTYRITLSKEHYTAISDSVTVTSQKKTIRTDTLVHSPAFIDSMAIAASKTEEKSKKLHTAIVAGVFGLFLLILGIIEVRE